MQAQQASEIRAKARDVDRGGVGDVDNNTPVLPRTSSGTALANACMNAETDGKYNRSAADNSELDSAAQGAHLCLLAAKSPKSNIYKTYDKTRRSRSFIPHWVVEYPWLEFNPEKECMFCVYCREYQRTHDPEFTNTFVHGATNFRLDSVKAHDHSTKHRQVMLVMSGRIASVPKPASKQASKASRQSSTGKGIEDRLRVGAFFDSEVDAGYEDSLIMGTHVSSVHKTHDDEGNQRHVTPSSDLTDEPFYPPNPMTKYIKTLQNIYPHLPVSEMASSETHPATTMIPQQLSSQSSTSSQAEDTPQQVIGQEERGEEQHIKDEPMSPGLEEQAQMESHGEKEQDAGEDLPSLTGGGRIGRVVPPMMKAWQVNKNEVSTMLRVEEDEDGETAGEYEQTGDDAAVNENLDEVDQEYDGEAEEGLLQRSGAMTDFFINPVVPVYRQGKRTTRLLPKAKRQKLEMIMARRMQGEDIVNGGEDSLGDQQFQSESDVDVATSTSSDPHWKHLAESFAARYNQLCEEHTNLMKLFQTKVSSLEKKCNDLEEACKTKQTESLTNSSQQNGIHGEQGATGSSHSSPRINMYSSVIVLQMQGQDPVNIRSNSDAEFNRVQQNLSQSGIHISLGGNNIPNTIEQQLDLHSGAGGQRSHSTSSSSPSAASSRKTEVAVTCTSENASRYNVSPERVKISSGTGNVGPQLVSGVGSNLQYDLEMQKSDFNLSGHQSQTSEKHGYLMGNGTVFDAAELSGNEPSASLSRTSVNDGIARETSQGNNPAKALAEPTMDVAGDQVSVSCPPNSLTSCTDSSSNDDGIV